MNLESLEQGKKLIQKAKEMQELVNNIKETGVGISANKGNTVRYSLNLHYEKGQEADPIMNEAICNIEDVTQTLLVNMLEKEIAKLEMDFKSL